MTSTSHNRRLAKKWVQCLNEALCPALAEFSAGRQFSVSNSALRQAANPCK